MRGRKGIDIFYINSSVSNRQLMKMWSRILHICPFATGLDMFNCALPGGGQHRIPYRDDQDKDVYGVLESTKVHINFTDTEERFGQEALKRLGIVREAPFVCFLSRSPDYLNTKFPRGNWHYHDYRDSDINSFIPVAVELTRRGYYALRMGAAVIEKLKTNNPMVIDYATKYRTDFLDIYLAAKCHFHLGDNCGFNCVPMIFRRPLAVVNLIPLEHAPTWGSDYLFIPKKLWLIKENRLLSFQEILGSEIGRFCYSRQYEESGIEVIENTPEEITALAVEMDLRLKGKWQVKEGDEELQRSFWALFKASGIKGVFRSRIGVEFLRQNKGLLE
jgi:putative glycosyltransferase (TIGR04372 family)